MRFLHTADWQIGMRATHVGEAGRRVREERLRAAERVVARAREAGVDFIVLAGDTFEHNGVDRVLVQHAGDILNGFGGPVYLLPGNHDPLVPGSVWEHPVWRDSGRLQVLRQAAPVLLDGVELLPCPVVEAHSRRDPTAWIPGDATGRVRVGIAHGTVEGVPQDELVSPIPRDAAPRHGLDYLALGHWHSRVEYTAADAVRMAYSGTPEPTKFGERDSGKALIVEIAAPGAAPAITVVETGRLAWVSITRDLRAPGELTELRAEVESVPPAESALLEISLTGLLFASDTAELTRLRELTAARPFLFTRITEAGLRPAPADNTWLERLPEGVIRSAGARLRELADPTYAGSRPEGGSAETAARALMELFALAAEVRS